MPGSRQKVTKIFRAELDAVVVVERRRARATFMRHVMWGMLTMCGRKKSIKINNNKEMNKYKINY